MPPGDDFGLGCAPADSTRSTADSPGSGDLVDVRGGDRERHAQPLQQLLAIDGGGSQHQPEFPGALSGRSSRRLRAGALPATNKPY